MVTELYIVYKGYAYVAYSDEDSMCSDCDLYRNCESVHRDLKGFSCASLEVLLGAKLKDQLIAFKRVS